MDFNTYMVNAQGRNKYGDYRKPVKVGKITDGSGCTYTLTDLVVTYSDGSSYLKPDLSNYATMTGTLNTYVNGDLRLSETGKTVTPLVRVDGNIMAQGDLMYWNYNQYSATTRDSANVRISGTYNGVQSTSSVFVKTGANTSAITASEILSFHITTPVSSSATSFDASGLGRRTITFTSGAQSTPVSAYIGNQADGWLYIKEDASWVSTDGSTVYVQENQTSSARTAVLTLTDASFTSATNTFTLTQSAGTPVWQECYFNFTYGSVAATQTGTWDEYIVFYNTDSSESPVDFGDPIIDLMCGQIIYAGNSWDPSTAFDYFVHSPFEIREPNTQVYVPQSFAGQTLYLQAEFGSADLGTRKTSYIVSVFIPETGGPINVTIPQF